MRSAMVIDEGRPIAEVGRAIGVNPGTLGNWVAASGSSGASVRASPRTTGRI